LLANHGGNIVLYTKNKADDKLLISILIKHYANVQVISTTINLIDHLREMSPKVVLVAGESFEDTLVVYYEALETLRESNICKHCIVSLIPKHEEKEAYDAYCSGIIDDYMIARPMYELHRPIVICAHLLRELGFREARTGNKDDFIEKTMNFPEHIKTLILSGVTRKEALQHELSQSIKRIDRALDRAEEHLKRHENMDIDVKEMKKMLANMRSDEIRPELLKIQEKTLSLLESVVADATRTLEKAAGLEDQNSADKAKQTKNYMFNKLYNVDEDPGEEATPKTPKVLIIEDDSVSMNLTIMLLRGFNIDIDTSISGKMALEMLLKNKYDLILMDINLPDANGLQLLSYVLRSHCINESTPIIMLTGNKNRDTVKQAIDTGAKGYIIKPLYLDSVTKLFAKYKLPLVKR
jgi:CheY-like chemotaxis protein